MSYKCRICKDMFTGLSVDDICGSCFAELQRRATKALFSRKAELMQKEIEAKQAAMCEAVFKGLSLDESLAITKKIAETCKCKHLFRDGHEVDCSYSN